MNTAPATITSIEPAPRITAEQLDLIRNTIAKDASDNELKLFLYDCARQNVHPLDRLIHFTKRSGKYTPITSIDLMRIRAAETGECLGISDAVFVGAPKEPMFAASVTVKRLVGVQVAVFTATARFLEYYPGDGDPGFMWRRMPYVMLGKCAEALALRKGFPKQLAGLYAKEELDQADANVAEAVAEAARPTTAHTTITKPQQRRLFTLATKAGWSKEQMRAQLYTQFGLHKTGDIPTHRYDEVCEIFAQPPAVPHGEEPASDAPF